MSPLDSAADGQHAFVVTDPLDAAAVAALQSYFAELADRFDDGFDAGDAVTADAEWFTPPAGVFLLAVHPTTGATLGCGAVQVLADGAAEIKRMWIDGDARGQGLGKGLLQELETHALELGNGVIRLDTNDVLLEAIAMYRSQGYVEVAAYNDNPYARHWFEKAPGNRADRSDFEFTNRSIPGAGPLASGQSAQPPAEGQA